MKKSILMLCFIIFINMQSQAQQEKQFIAATSFSAAKPISFSVPVHSGPDKDYDYYMQKSKKSRNTGLILLGSGVAVSGIGAILAFGDNSYPYNQSKEDAGVVMLITGAAAGIASIPFMAIALGHSNSAKASLSSQKTGFGVPPGVSKNIVGLSISFTLGK